MLIKGSYVSPPIQMLASSTVQFHTLNAFLFQPFVDRHHFIHGYFLPRVYAILIPVVAGLIVLALLGW